MTTQTTDILIRLREIEVKIDVQNSQIAALVSALEGASKRLESVSIHERRVDDLTSEISAIKEDLTDLRRTVDRWTYPVMALIIALGIGGMAIFGISRSDAAAAMGDGDGIIDIWPGSDGAIKRLTGPDHGGDHGLD